MIWVEVAPRVGPPVLAGADTDARYLQLKIGNAVVQLDVDSADDLASTIVAIGKFQRMRTTRAQMSNANRSAP